jgi:hypothetical protein
MLGYGSAAGELDAGAVAAEVMTAAGLVVATPAGLEAAGPEATGIDVASVAVHLVQTVDQEVR